jgi:hypothetical protein
MDAAALRRQMRDPKPLSSEGKPMGLKPGRLEADNRLRNLVLAPQHALWFSRWREESTGLTVLLFGELVFGQIVDTAGLPVPEMAWRLDPNQPDADGRTTFRALIDGAVRRSASQNYPEA